jgi:high-affinity iron transporter
VFSNAIIGLREGLEAALVVGILLAYVLRSDRKALARSLWAGVAGALGVSVAVALMLNSAAGSLGETGEPIFAGVMSIATVGLVTWMIFWMKRTARSMRSDLQGKLDIAMNLGPAAVAGIAFVAVAREGVETALFLWTASSAGSNPVSNGFGAAAGLAIAVLLGRAIYKGALKVNLAKFFRISGIALIVIAAGVLAGGICDLQEVGFLPGINTLAWDLSTAIPENSMTAIILDGLAGFSVKMTTLQLASWVGFTAIVLAAFLRPTKSVAVSSATSQQPQSELAESTAPR